MARNNKIGHLETTGNHQLYYNQHHQHLQGQNHNQHQWQYKKPNDSFSYCSEKQLSRDLSPAVVKPEIERMAGSLLTAKEVMKDMEIAVHNIFKKRDQ